MKKIKCICISMFIIAGSVVGGIEDHVIYDKVNRYSLDALDAIVMVKVNHYYAFAEPRILMNYVYEHNRHLSEWSKGSKRSGTGSQYWCSLPDLNALDLLMEYTYWVADAEVTKCLYGECETKKIYIILKKTPAFFAEEAPLDLLKDEVNSVSNQRILGLVKINPIEFSSGFRNKYCYMKDTMEVVREIKKEVKVNLTEQFDTTIIFSGNESCYVMRDVGITYETSEFMRKIGREGGESQLMKTLRKNKEKGLPDEFKNQGERADKSSAPR